MNGEMGVSPYDGLAFILGNKLRDHVPYFIVRIAYDGLAVVIGFIAGAAAGISYGLNPLFGKPLTVNIIAGIAICIAAVHFMILSEKK